MTLIMYDSIYVSSFPASGFQATAGYVNGKWPNSAAMQARFPNLPHVALSVFASGAADGLDVENGDATPDEAPGWIDTKWNRRLALPILYCNTSMIGAVRAAVGPRPFLWWSASYWLNQAMHLDAGAEATQFWDHGPNGENVDQTVMTDRFYAVIGGTPTPPPAPAPVIDPTSEEDEMYLIGNPDGGVLSFSPSAVGGEIVPDTGRLSVFLGLGVKYGPAGLNPAQFQHMDWGPFRLWIEHNGGIRPIDSADGAAPKVALLGDALEARIRTLPVADQVQAETIAAH